jgi:ribokinase
MTRILNFGSINVDHVYTVDRFVAAGETLASTSLSLGPGGKGFNQSIALARAGARVMHGGCLGRDAEWLRERLQSEKVDISRLTLVDQPAGHAIIQVTPSGQNAIVLHPGSNHAVSPRDLPALFAEFTKDDWFLTQNETSCVPEALACASAAGMTVCFNPAPMHPVVRAYPLELVDWLIVNEHEGAELGGGGTPEEVLSHLRRLCPHAHLVLTLGSEGVWCSPPTGDTIRVPAQRVRAVDTTGAGDTFIGFLIAATMQEQPLSTALSLACRAAAWSVTRPGAADSIPRLEQIANDE